MKAPNKIPKLYPTETIEIEGNKIELRGLKPSDKEYEIIIRKLRNEAIGLQIQTNRIIRDEENNTKPDKDLSEEDSSKLVEIYNELDDIGDQMDEVCMFLAQRGLKRFYYPGKTTSELDEIEDIEIIPGHAKTIADKMIKLSNPPEGLKKSIEAAEKEKADGKGKSEKSVGRKTSQSKKKS